MTYDLIKIQPTQRAQRGVLGLALMMLALWSGGLSGCADSTAPASEMIGGGEVPLAGTTAGTPVAGTMPPAGSTFVLQSATDQTLVDVGGMLELRLRYIMNGSTPVANRRLSFQMLNQAQQPMPNGVDGSTLSAASTTTNERGETSVTVYAGQVATSFLVQASDPTNQQTAPIFWRISVANAGEGGLDIAVTYNVMGRYTYNQFASARVSLFQNVSCDELRARAPNLVNAYEVFDIAPYNDLDNRVSSASLPMGLNLSVTAILYNQGGSPITFGCAQNVVTQGGQLLPVTVETSDLPLAFKGVYTAVNRFNLIDALRDDDDLGTLGDVFYFLRVLGGSNESLGNEVINTVCDIADLPGIACDIIRGVAGGEVGRIINDQLPPNIRQVLRVIGETLDIVGDLTIVGEIEFSQSANSEGVFVNNDNRWQRIRFDWEIDCATPGMCEREVTMNQLGRHSRSVAGIFDAQERTDGKVEILDHNFNIAYGSILLGLLEAWIIPLALNDNTGGAIQLEDFLRINLSGPCESINENFGLPADSTTCLDTLSVALSALIRDQAGQLNFDEGALIMSGEFTPVDSDSDLSIDKLDQGSWRGVINGGLEFQGCFTACRNMECPDPVCQITTAP